LAYLGRTDFSQLAPGRHEVDGDDVYAVVQRYSPRPVSEATWEVHREYLDIQYVAEGVERIGYAPLGRNWTVRQEYNAQKDCALYDARGDLLEVAAGSFALFTPYDIHAPGLMLNSHPQPGEVLKVVMKCRV